MHLVAALGQDPHLTNLLRRYRDPHGRYHLHPLLDTDPAAALAGLVPLEFAGAIVLDEDLQELAAGSLQRRSLDAQEVGAVDTITVAAGGLIGEYNFGRAVRSMLQGAGWDGRNATAVLLGTGRRVTGLARELSSLGVSRLVLVADNQPAAERSAPRLAASTEVIPRSASDPAVERYLAEADLLVRADPSARVRFEWLGPHLSLIDLSPEPVTRLRQQALNVGALSFNLQDLQAHFLALALSHVLGGAIDVEPLLELLHDTPAF